MIGAQAIKGDVVIQDVTSNIIDVNAVQEIASTTLATDATVDTSTVTLLPGHGAVIGNHLAILSAQGAFIGEIINVATNVITINNRFNNTYPIGTAALITDSSMVGDFSAGDKVFGIRSGTGRKFDFYTLKLVIECATAPDDSKFGDQDALAKGFIFRKKISATQYNNLFTIRKNRDFGLHGIKTYSDKAGGGNHSVTFEYKFPADHGAASRIDGDLGQQIEIIPQDNITVLSMEAVLQGHFVTDSNGMECYTLSQTEWTPITEAGQSGTCWLVEGEAAIITHSSTGPGGIDEDKAYIVRSTAVALVPDVSIDVFYAKARTASPVKMVVDV